jgi:redox-sensing transcriptional repressor
MKKAKIPSAPSVRRFPSYLRLLRDAETDEQGFISGARIAAELSLEAIQVRKDLALTGITGTPRKGYPVEALIGAIERYLGWDSVRDAVLVGAGNLGSALLGYAELPSHGLNIAAAFDNDARKIGGQIHGLVIQDVAALATALPRLHAKIAVLTVPAAAAQKTAEALSAAGITGIWNFTRAKLNVSPAITVQNEDLSAGYALLCVKMIAGNP